jgi:lysophospholipase L1-like esterase
MTSLRVGIATAALCLFTAGALAQTPASAPADKLQVKDAGASAQENLLKGCNFGEGIKGWGGVGDDEKKSVAVVDLEGGKKGLQLSRKAEGAVGIDQTVSLKPQTLYKLSITGFGKAQTSIRLRPASSKDKEFATVLKPWAITTAPLIVGEQSHTTDFFFDSGLKADSTAVMVYLTEPKDLGAYAITALSLTEAGSAKPADDETIVLHLGDSFTAGIYLPVEQRLPTLLQAMLAKALPTRKVRQINLAADGEYIKDLLGSNRYKKIVKENLERVDIAVIRYGGNDSRFGTAEDFKKQMATLCDNLVKDYPKITIVLSTGTYLKGNDDVNLKQYAPYWQATRDLAKERGLALVDVYARFDKEQSDKLTRNPGDMHPSAEGVRLMAEEEFAVLKSLLAGASTSPAKN